MAKADPFFTFYSFLKHKFFAHGPRHLHSPFVYDLFHSAIKPGKKISIPEIERARASLKNNDALIEVRDFKNDVSAKKSISSIAHTSVSNREFSGFLRMLVQHLDIKVVVETGTSLGINAAYLAYENSGVRVISLEGNDEISDIAGYVFRDLQINNITLIRGEANELLPEIVRAHKPEMVFIDADHRGASIEFCVNALRPAISAIKVIVIHDIYWSKDMNAGWNRLISDSRFPLTIDIFQAGLIFPNLEMEKQHFHLKF